MVRHRRAALGMACTALVALLVTFTIPGSAQRAGAQGVAVPFQPNKVDVELVLAIDISRSVDWEEGLLQRKGYISAFSNPLLLAAIQEGYYGRIAVTYFEWSTWGDVRVVAPWMVIGDAPSAARFTDILRREFIWQGQRTSISQAIDFGASLFALNAVDGDRKVIDISGDGINNSGRHINDSRQEAVAKGITINGLPIINSRAGPGTPPPPDLDAYYKECVIGGAGAFIVVADGFEKFAEAITRKLILEIAGLAPEARPDQFAPEAREDPYVRAQFLNPRQMAPPAAAPPRYGPWCDGPPQGGGGQLPPQLPLPR
jgi:hypothetical protein